MNTTIIVAIITALSAIAPQLISNHMNNKHQMQLKKIELFEMSKKDAIINFISAVAQCTDKEPGVYNQDLSDYYKNLNILRTYFPSIDKKLLDNLTSVIQSTDTEIQNKMTPIIEELSKLLVEIK